MAWTVERLIDEIDLLGARGLPRKEFFAELAPRLRNVIDNDASCWHTLDPHTRLLTSDAPDGADRARRLHARRGPGRRGADRPQRVHGRRRQHLRRPRRAARARRHPRPRHARRSRSAARATATCSCRPTSPTSCAPPSSSAAASGAPCTSPAARAAAPFEQRDADALAAVTGAIARGIRASLRFDAARRVDGRRGARARRARPTATRSSSITPPARELLASLRPDESALHRRDDRHAGARARVVRPRRARRPVRAAANVVTVPGSDGWVTLHASLPGPPGDGRVAVVLERAGGRALGDRPPRGVRRDRPRARGRHPPGPRPVASRDGRDARRSPRTPSRTTSRASTRSSASPRGRSSSPACSSTSTSPRWRARRR